MLGHLTSPNPNPSLLVCFVLFDWMIFHLFFLFSLVVYDFPKRTCFFWKKVILWSSSLLWPSGVASSLVVLAVFCFMLLFGGCFVLSFGSQFIGFVCSVLLFFFFFLVSSATLQFLSVLGFLACCSVHFLFVYFLCSSLLLQILPCFVVD